MSDLEAKRQFDANMVSIELGSYKERTPEIPWVDWRRVEEFMRNRNLEQDEDDDC